jgi:glycosyltransferase involved in cell wall biosynthesis
MIKVMDIVYHHHSEFDMPGQVLEKHAPSLGFADFTHPSVQLVFVKHLDYDGFDSIKGHAFAFFRSSNKFWHIPYKTQHYVKSQKPDIVIVEGLVFPLQLIWLKWMLGKNIRIIAQHHGEKPFGGIKGLLQKIADRYINAYLFTSVKNASAWLNQKIISNPGKCKEVLEASTHFRRRNKSETQTRLGISGVYNFLWVGRLNKNKNPLMILSAFKKYSLYHPGAKLYMIFREDDMLEEIKMKISQSIILEEGVRLIGKVAHDELIEWYSAIDFYISGSWEEGSGYSLLEAMACGCIPVVTSIPSFNKITENGKYGHLYPPGDTESLTRLLENLSAVDIDGERTRIENYFQEKLSFKSIAENLNQVFAQL